MASQSPPKSSTATKPRVRIEDVAEAAEVSIMSVSRVMRGVEGVSPAKREEILKIAKQLGYQPSSVAGSLAAANSTLIGVSVPTLNDEVFGEIFRGMREVFNRSGFQSVFDTTEYKPQREEDWIDRMIAWRPAGIVLSGVNHSKSARRKLINSGIPTLEIWDHSETPIELCVSLDHKALGAEMAQHLLHLGYRRPAYVGVELRRDIRADKRLEGFENQFLKAGCRLEANIRLEEVVSFEAGQLGVAQLLDRAEQLPDVIYFLNDHMALGGMMECERRGISVPEKIGIVGFNGLNINRVLEKPITTSITPRLQMGHIGASMLVARIRNGRSAPAQTLDAVLFEGKTTRRLMR